MATIDRTLPTAAVKRNVRAEQMREFWHYFSENNGAVAGLVVVCILVLLAVFADLVAPHSPIEQFREHFLAPPVWMEGGSWERSEEHTSELQSLMRISYAVFCLKKNTQINSRHIPSSLHNTTHY